VLLREWEQGTVVPSGCPHPCHRCLRHVKPRGIRFLNADDGHSHRCHCQHRQLQVLVPEGNANDGDEAN